jgi:hypothetical protein
MLFIYINVLEYIYIYLFINLYIMTISKKWVCRENIIYK